MPIHIHQIKESFFNALEGREWMPFDDYLEWALYDSVIGYYTQKKLRVGKSEDSDFYTSTSLQSSVWGQLLIQASCSLLSHGHPDEFVFVEIAAEPGESSLGNLPHPFQAIKTIRLGDPFNIPEKAIVFSNEWLDAQPFKRFRFDPMAKKWGEIGVTWQEGKWMEVILPSQAETLDLTSTFPQKLNIAYTVDWPTGAENALDELFRKPWRGLFITFDYGLDRERILNDFPDGTGRAYLRHQLNHDILADPGSKDITCHLCWNEVREQLELATFTNIDLQSQESFFMRHAPRKMQEIIENKASPATEVRALKELIHPQHLGQKFQVLHGWR